jgi:hypothetical protein
MNIYKNKSNDDIESNFVDFEGEGTKTTNEAMLALYFADFVGRKEIHKVLYIT